MNRLLFICCLLCYFYFSFSLNAQNPKVYPHHLWGTWEESTANSSAANDLQSIVTFEKDGNYQLQIGNLKGEGKWQLIHHKQRIKIKRFHYIEPKAQSRAAPYDFELDVRMPNDSTLVLIRKRHGETYQATYKRRAAAFE